MKAAPLALACEDLARHVVTLVAGWSQPAFGLVGGATVEAAAELAIAAQIALVTPRERGRAILRADAALIGLRVRLRLARTLGALSEGALLDCAERMQRIGRMLGGWQRARDSKRLSGDEPPATGA